jgi:hypothetical protein
MKSTGLLHRPPTSVRPQGVWSLPGPFLRPRATPPPAGAIAVLLGNGCGQPAPRRSGPEATQSRLSFVASSTLIPFLAFISADASSDEWDPHPPSSPPFGLRPLLSKGNPHDPRDLAPTSKFGSAAHSYLCAAFASSGSEQWATMQLRIRSQSLRSTPLNQNRSLANPEPQVCVYLYVDIHGSYISRVAFHELQRMRLPLPATSGIPLLSPPLLPD